MRLSNNFRLSEFTRSDTAKRLGKEIKKTPPHPSPLWEGEQTPPQPSHKGRG